MTRTLLICFLFEHNPARNFNPIYELSPKGKLPKICPLRRTRSHHCVALNLALLAGRKLFHLPPLLKMYHWGEHGQNVVANSTLSFLPWGAFNKYMEIILPFLLLTYLNLDSFYYEGRQKLTMLGHLPIAFFFLTEVTHS